MFLIVADPWVKNCFLSPSILLGVHLLLYVMIMILSNSVMLCGSTSFGCEESSPCRTSRVLSLAQKAGLCITPAYCIKHWHCLCLLILQAVCSHMNEYVVEVVASTKVYSIQCENHGSCWYDDHLRINCAGCYFHYPMLYTMSNIYEYPLPHEYMVEGFKNQPTVVTCSDGTLTLSTKKTGIT